MVRFSSPLDSHQQRRIQRIRLRAVTPLAGAHAPPLFARRFLHFNSLILLPGPREPAP
jgi:hypothetical protein